MTGIYDLKILITNQGEIQEMDISLYKIMMKFGNKVIVFSMVKVNQRQINQLDIRL